MDESLYNLHLEFGKASGIESTCGKKTKFSTEEKAIKAATHHNQWDKRRNDVEPYPCFFCKEWHIGKIIPLEILKNATLNQGSLS